MARLTLLLLLGVAGCDVFGPGQEGAVEMSGWRYASGKTPSRAEYGAMVAACQDGAVPRSSAKPLDACLADLGLKRAP
jgi:hypothetical protein